MTDTILFSRADHIARLVLNNPGRHNALGRVQLEAIQRYLEQVECDSQVRVLIVTGEGESTFCAGASLDELNEHTVGDNAFQAMTRQLAEITVPTICAMNGDVFGGGVELAVSCDFRIGVEGCRMRVPAAQLGLCYPMEGIRRFLECLGPGLTKRILIACEEFDDSALLRAGIVDHLVTRGKLTSFTENFALRIVGLAPLAVQSMKGILRQIASDSIDTEYVRERTRLCLESMDLQEGFAAKREKRTPRFNGK